jgi:hypothetical protein
LVKKLRVQRKGYHRKGYHRKAYTRKNGTKVKAANVKACYVPPSTYLIKDRGAPGRGKKVLPKLRPGAMTDEARKIGVLKKGERVGDLSMTEIEKLARHLRRKYGQRRSSGMFRSQLVFRKRQPDGFKSKMERGFEVTVGKRGVLD